MELFSFYTPMILGAIPRIKKAMSTISKAVRVGGNYFTVYFTLHVGRSYQP